MKKRQKILVIVVILALLASGAVGFVYFGQKLNSDAVKEPTSQKKETKPAEPEKVAVRLPGADPVYDVKAEYFAEDGIWALVNKQKPLPNQEYRPVDLVAPGVTVQADKSAEEMSIRQVVTTPLQELFAAAKADGIDLMIGSAFRSHTLQNYYYTNMVRSYGQAEADRVSAKPGTSEHQLGLAIDFTTPAQTCRLEQCFENTPAGLWLKDNAHKYGFILRYTKDGEPITGYIYEPWHFRYVGKDLATAFYNSSVNTFEEAYPYLEEARAKLSTN